jgi:hypothetical protein
LADVEIIAMYAFYGYWRCRRRRKSPKQKKLEEAKL